MKEAFCLFDRDADGFIQAREISTVIRSLGINLSDTEFCGMLKGKEETMFSYEEFAKLVGDRCSVAQDEELNKAFKIFDRDNNGTVSARELKHVLLNLGEKLSEAEVDELISVADPHKAGTVKYKEFVALLCGK